MSYSVHRTLAPVRRFSKPAGSEGAFWRPFDPRDVSRFMLAAERFERTRRKKGERCGPLGPVGLEVLRELLRLVDFKRGRLEPAILTLCSRLKRSKDAVVRALANLRAHGFLDWIRRWISDSDGMVKQTTNAYRLVLPPAAIALLGALFMVPPAPDDASAAQDDRAAAYEAMVRDVAGDVDQMALQFSDQPALVALARARKKNAT